MPEPDARMGTRRKMAAVLADTAAGGARHDQMSSSSGTKTRISVTAHPSSLQSWIQCLDAYVFAGSKALDYVWVDAVIDQPVRGYAMLFNVVPERLIAYHLMHLPQ